MPRRTMFRVSSPAWFAPSSTAAAETSGQTALFHGHDQRQLLDGLEQGRPVERLDEPGVDDADLKALFLQLGRRLDAGGEKVP